MGINTRANMRERMYEALELLALHTPIVGQTRQMLRSENDYRLNLGLSALMTGYQITTAYFGKMIVEGLTR